MSSESSSSSRRRRIPSFTPLFVITFSLLTVGIYTDLGLMELSPLTSEKPSLRHTKTESSPSVGHRKLLHKRATEDGKERAVEDENQNGVVQPNRIWSEKCSKSDIAITQGPTQPLPNGIPTYTVEIMNVCVSGCAISAIHVSCGWFSSARIVNPRVFKRLRFNVCLVNEGKPLFYGRTLSFQYANTFRYSLSVSSVSC